MDQEKVRVDLTLLEAAETDLQVELQFSNGEVGTVQHQLAAGESGATFEVALPEGGDVISTLTSGSHSPSLGTGIAMAYLPAESAKIGTLVDVIIRDRRFPFEVVKKPFV